MLFLTTCGQVDSNSTYKLHGSILMSSGGGAAFLSVPFYVKSILICIALAVALASRSSSYISPLYSFESFSILVFEADMIILKYLEC